MAWHNRGKRSGTTVENALAHKELSTVVFIGPSGFFFLTFAFLDHKTIFQTFIHPFLEEMVTIQQ